LAVDYYFKCVSGDGNDSGWVSDRTYTNSGLAEGEYCYKVRARDKNSNITGWSPVACATTGGGGGPGTPAAPTNLNAVAISDTQINLFWTDNSDNETGFKIERRIGAAPFVQIATVGENVTTYNNIGLAALTTYTYRVRAYNGVGDSGYSNEASATTLGGPGGDDTTAPIPNPSQWATTATGYAGSGYPNLWFNPATGSYWHRMEAVVTDDTTTGGNNPVEYYFDRVSGSGVDSGWQTQNWYIYEVAFSPSHAVYRVKARDSATPPNETGWSVNHFTADPPGP
jgi:hypothetical protein